MAITTVKTIDEPKTRNIVLYKFNNQNIGIANVIEISTEKIVISLIFINCSNLK